MRKTKKIYSNTKKNIRKKYKHGGEISIDAKEIPNFDVNNSYSSEQLGLIHKHSLSLHHNKMDLSLIADINLDTNKNSIYTDKRKDPKNHIKQLLQKYGIKTFNKSDSSLRVTILVGESIKNNLVIPIFLNDDDTGYFYDIEGKRYIPTFKKQISKILNKTVYLFSLPDEYENENIDQHSEEIAGNLQKGETVSNFQMLQTVGIDDHLQQYIYKFNRIHISKEQKETISTCFLDYKLLYNLNYDDSKDEKGNYVYKSHQKFSFFSYDKIVKACSSWYSYTPNEQFKKCLLVGFTIPYGGIRRAVYLKSNGFFSDGYADYFPTFETIQITQDIISKLFKENGQTDLDFLVNKIAYEFSYGTETAYNVVYNQDFRNTLYEMYVWGPLKSCAIGLVVALLFAALPMVWGTVFVLPNVATTVGTSLVVSTSVKGSVAAIDYTKNNKVRGKDQYKEGGRKSKKIRYKKSQKRKHYQKLIYNKTLRK